jgi:hypothetical protein
MPDIILQDINPRIQMVAAGGQTVFAYPFPIYANTDLIVYQRAAAAAPNDLLQVLVYVANYTVTNNAAPAVGGIITLNVGATAGDIITIIRNMPENRLVNYLDGGLWSATQFNTDFDRTVMMAQTNTMFERVIAPHYNTNDVINTNSNALSSGVDTYLPVLLPNTVWMKNNANTAIVSVTLTPGGGAPVILPTVVDSIATFSNTTGTIQSSLGRLDALGNLTTFALFGLTGVTARNGSTVNFNNAADTFGIGIQAQASLAANFNYQLPNAYPTVAGQFLSSTGAGPTSIMSWAGATIVNTGTLTNANVLAMSAAPIQIVAAPVAGFANIVKSFYLEFVFNTAAFANGGVVVLQYGNAALGAGTNTVSNGVANTIAAAFLTGGVANQFTTLVNNTNWPTTASAGITASAIFISNQTAAFTNAPGGLSTLRWAVEYMTVPMP